MRVLLISPLGFAINQDTKYGGIERLVWNYSSELIKYHSIFVFGHSDSKFPQGVEVFGIRPYSNEDIYQQSELRQYQSFSPFLHEFDVIHDFSHSHLASRFNPNLPSLNLIWHAPFIAQFPKAPYNIICPSRWAVSEFRRFYRQDARFQQTIALDLETYKIHPHFNTHRTDRFLTLGAMTPRKGNLEAVMLCKELGFKLDVVGKGYGDDYEKRIRKMCDGSQIIYKGEISDEEKVRLMQRCKALVFYNNEPEVTSHKLQEALLCGASVVATNVGALPEIVTRGVNGYLCKSKEDFKKALLTVDKLDPMKVYKQVQETYSIGNVVKGWLPLYEQVKDGLRWK